MKFLLYTVLALMLSLQLVFGAAFGNLEKKAGKLVVSKNLNFFFSPLDFSEADSKVGNIREKRQYERRLQYRPPIMDDEDDYYRPESNRPYYPAPRPYRPRPYGRSYGGCKWGDIC